MSRHLIVSAFSLMLLLLVGCGPPRIDTTYGRTRGRSINGTGALAELFRLRGHEVRTAVRATPTLREWAGVLVRFAEAPGPPERDEAKWLMEWLNEQTGRRLIYVPYDYDAEPEFWSDMLAALPRGAPESVVKRYERKRDESKPWASELPPRAKNPAPADHWFGVVEKPPAPSTCKELGGPWAEGVDAKAAAITRHAVFTSEDEDDDEILLSGDGKPLVLGWTLDNGSEVLVVANASFLVNAAIVNPARRRLTARVVDWVEEPGSHVAFLEGGRLLAEAGSPSASPLDLLKVAPFGWVAAHLAGFGLLLCLAMATTLGRPRREPPGEVERPSAHPEALGSLLAKTGRADVARLMLESYRRWRHPASARSKPTTTASASATTPTPTPPR